MILLNENYHGEVYHFTSLVQASWIFEDNFLDARISQSEDCEGRSDNRKYASEDAGVISFTRDKNYNIQGNNNATSVCFVFDGDDLQKIRNARLYPYAFSGRGEAEERLYGVRVFPLNKYVKRVEVRVKHGKYSWMSDRGFDEEEELYEKFEEKYPDLSSQELDEKIQEYLIKKLLRSRRFAGKVKVLDGEHQKVVNLNEEKIRQIVAETLRKFIN